MTHRLALSLAIPVCAALFVSGCATHAGSPTSEGGATAPAGTQVRPDEAARPLPEPDQRPSDVPPTDMPPRSPDQNPTVDTREDNLSTFALDVDTGSWTRTRQMFREGERPAPGEVRTEEFVNYFDQGYRPPAEGLGVYLDGTSVPFLESPRSRVLRVGVQSAVVDQSQRPPANLTFVIDVSGSMAQPGKLDLVKSSLAELVGSLRPDDTVTIVVYSDNTRVALPQTPASRGSTIVGVIEDLETEGSTNAEAGLQLGYEQALRNRDEGEINRVVLLSDGVANVGNTGPEAILETIGKAAQQDVDLVTVGFGMGTYNDNLMEQLANQGNGFNVYVDSEAEARRVFTQNLTGTLVVTARDAKAQVEFNADNVESYRLLGYENRDVADDDFRNDSVDGGEVGAGHSTTAVYEITLREDISPNAPLARATVRYQDPDTRTPVERNAEISARQLAASPEEADPHLQSTIVVATFSESLRGGPWAKHRTPQEIAGDAQAVSERLPGTKSRELVEITALAAD